MHQAIVDGVTQAVLDQGFLTKAQIKETWAIREEDYKELQSRVLAGNTAIEKGPKGVGGLKSKKRMGKCPDDAIGDSLLLRTNWEAATVARLGDLLSLGVLEDLLGPLVQTLWSVRQAETGRNRRGTKRELAAALVIQHGVDLFCDCKIRKSVAKAAGVSAPANWHPGKPAAINFVVDSRFPRELAGIPAEDSLPDCEYLVGRFRLPQLLEFQEEVKGKLDQTLREPGSVPWSRCPPGRERRASPSRRSATG